MKLKTQKRLAADLLKCSKKRVSFDTERLDEIKESITKRDIVGLIKDKAIKKKQTKGISRVRANKIKTQKAKGRRKGPGSKKGKHSARLPKKQKWMNKVRLQRKFIKELKDKEIITSKSYQMLYSKTSGGFFRSRKHIKLYIKENDLIKENGKR
ncbi:MAG TPA: 50S ribosomal protein L19e [Candidatus Woesearchaeota archaeon]|nr:50S ribosomal protein L19e [Candidatus Woesearchaeota archaeon]